MYSRLAFGRRKQYEDHGQPNNKLMKLPRRGAGIRHDCDKACCRAGACSYSAFMEASKFRAEVTTKKAKAKQKGAGASSSSDCDSSLYDSFELDCFSHKLGRCLAEERHPSDVAHSWQSQLAPSQRQQQSHVVPRWHSRRRTTSCCPFTFPSCFPKRTPTIQLGKRRNPSLHGALHVIAKVARRGCHVIAGLPACRRHGEVQQQQQQPLKQTEAQAQLHYHHHLHHYSLEGLRGAHDCDSGNNEDDERNGNVHKVALRVLPPHLHEGEPAMCLSSPHTLAYFPLQEMDPHLTSIIYHT